MSGYDQAEIMKNHWQSRNMDVKNMAQFYDSKKCVCVATNQSGFFFDDLSCPARVAGSR